MSKVYVIVRETGESSLEDCIQSVEEREFDYEVIKEEPLEQAVRVIIDKGVELMGKYDWVLVLDADVKLTMSREEIEVYCYRMGEDNLFCFTGYLDCTQRGLIDGLHFYKIRYCLGAQHYLKTREYSKYRGHEEFEMVQALKLHANLNWKVGDQRVSFGTHYWYVNHSDR